MKNFRDLIIWQRSHLFTLRIYETTINYPREEMFGLVSQMKRSSTSIPTNIAEGCGRNSESELAQFLTIAMGSAAELEYQLILSKDLHYLNETTYNSLSKEIIEIRKMLNVFIRKLRTR